MTIEDYPSAPSLPDEMYWPQTPDERARMFAGHEERLANWRAEVATRQRRYASAREFNVRQTRGYRQSP